LPLNDGYRLFVAKMGCTQLEVGFAPQKVHLRYTTTPPPPSELWGDENEAVDLQWAEKHLHLPSVDEILVPLSRQIQTDAHFIQKDEQDEYVLYHIPYKTDEVSWI
jgi:hypothetical protein